MVLKVPKKLHRNGTLFLIVLLLAGINCYFLLKRAFEPVSVKSEEYDLQQLDSQPQIPGMKHVSLDEIVSRFARKTRYDCPKMSDLYQMKCRKVNSKDGGDEDEDEEDEEEEDPDCWMKSVNLLDLRKHYLEGLEPIPLFRDDEYIFDFEGKLLQDEPIRSGDMDLLPDLKLSTVTPLKKDFDGECRLGEFVRFRVDVINSRGEARSRGLDEVRAWVVKGDPLTGYSSTAQVTDLDNGSYLVEARCLWPGDAILRIGVVYPREYLRTVVDQFRRRPLRPLAARFKRGETEAITTCAATPNLPYPCLCNFTLLNGKPFYCGRPLNEKLECKDFSLISQMTILNMTDGTRAERDLASHMARNANTTLIKGNIHLKTDTKYYYRPKNWCYKTSYNYTWDQPSPKGYWSPGVKWTPTFCKVPVESELWPYECLEDTSIWLFGDSNLRHLTYGFAAIVDCEWTTDYIWPQNMTCVNEQFNIKVHMYRHEYPYYVPRGSWSTKRFGSDVAKLIDSVPSSGKHFVIAHIYLHFSADHPSAVYQRLVDIRDAMVRLLDRNPSAKVGLMGPHVVYTFFPVNHIAGGDNTATLYRKKFYDEIFADLKDRIIFLDNWDMTVALENGPAHPDMRVRRETARLFLGMVCPP